jgi:glycine betaine/choline ABC-type transport system substrate-binding protein
MTAQAFIDRPYVPDLLIRENVSKDYPGVPAMVNAMIDTIQTDGVDSLRDTDD